MEVTQVTVPHVGWKPRPHQQRLWEYLQAGGKRAMAIWHRRAGKDEVCLHHIMRASTLRAGNYWYALPEYAQGRKAIWTAINPHTGKRRIDEAFPKELRTGYSEAEMFIRFHNSTFQIIGSDTYDSTVGASVAGIVYSEFALANPSAWAYHRPILEENKGWAAFVSTPRGRNFAYSMFQFAQQSPEWFCELLTVNDTNALTPEALAETLKEYKALYGDDVGDAQYRQEYFCDWNAAILGGYFTGEMAMVRKEDRITHEAEADPDRAVHRAWDLGVKDDTSIWWWQQQGGQLIILDHYAASGVGVEHYAEIIEKKNKQYGWRDGTDWVPHDAKVKEWGSGKTRVETMETLGLHPQLVRMATFQDGINAVRRTLPLCVFHPRTEETGIAALEQYRREWDDEKKAFRQSDVHDWTSHPSAAFRYLSLAWRLAERRETVEPKREGWVIPPPAEERGGIRL